MDYEEKNISDNQKKFSTGLIVTIACAIIIVAGAAWFALTRYNSDTPISDMRSNMESGMDNAVSDIESDVNSVTSRIESEYEDITSSYNDTVSKAESNMKDNAEPTGENVSSVPYESLIFSMPVEGKIIKGFNNKELQYSKTFGDMRLHTGIDIACKEGTAVSACGDAKVLTIEENSLYGTVVTLDLGNGLTAKYASLKDLKVKQGDQVKSGDILGVTAAIPAELSDEAHLHFEVFKNNTAADPLEALKLN